MKFQIIETSTKDLTTEQFHLLRKMTLEGESQMKVVLDNAFRYQDVPCLIAVVIESDDWMVPIGMYLGWSLVTNYWHNKEKFVQVYVKPEYRQQGIGRSLVNHFRDRYQTLGLASREKLFCYRWDDNSTLFYNSLNMIDVFTKSAAEV